jgi:AraC-like DNA-binding protein
MLVERPPCPALRAWISRVWAADERPQAGERRWRERLVPTGAFHLVLRLDDSRIRIFDDLDDARGQIAWGVASFARRGPSRDGAGTVPGFPSKTFSDVIGGARSRFHVRAAAAGARSVGLLIRPGAAGVIMGVPAHELAERHTSLEDVWGPAARALRERLLDTPGPARQLEVLEQAVVARLDVRLAPHAAVREALSRFGSAATGWEVGVVRRDTRLSHRRFVELFRRQVGLGPKQLCRVLRLRRAMTLARGAASSWAAIAAGAGYFDQPHLVRDFRAIAGVSPTEWRALATRSPLHIPIPG